MHLLILTWYVFGKNQKALKKKKKKKGWIVKFKKKKEIVQSMDYCSEDKQEKEKRRHLSWWSFPDSGSEEMKERTEQTQHRERRVTFKGEKAQG